MIEHQRKPESQAQYRYRHRHPERVREAQRKYHKANPDKVLRWRRNGKATKAATNRRAYDRAKAFLYTIKLERGCAVCGYREHPEALDFAHIDPKEKRFSIGLTALNRKSTRAALLSEIEKCRVLCANCHRVETVQKRHHTFRRETAPELP